ncbi:oligosaccharyl transferase subunit ost3/OST6 [Podila epigama]|nr:oligosaccharyl transferase subunit ost3/OST6 [Podila epigama]
MRGLSRTTLFSVGAMLSLALMALPSLFSSSSGMALAQPSGDALLSKKFTRLSAKASANKGIIQLDSTAFDEVMAKPRNYSMVVLFTAMGPEFNCIPCQNFDPEYKMVASGWSKLPEKKLFFGVLDFRAGQDIFKRMGMNSAPTIIYFPETAAESIQDRYDFGKLGGQAETFVAWLNSRAGTSLKVNRPIDYLSLAVKVLSFIAVGFFLYLLATKAGTVLGSKYIWSGASLYVILIMISGHMWNQIRNPPYTAPTRDGRPGFIAQGFQSQFGLESQIVAILYALICASSIVLMSVVPKISNPTQQRFVIWIAMGAFAFFFSVLIKMFQVKNPSYPFSLMFK